MNRRRIIAILFVGFIAGLLSCQKCKDCIMTTYINSIQINKVPIELCGDALNNLENKTIISTDTITGDVQEIIYKCN